MCSFSSGLMFRSGSFVSTHQLTCLITMFPFQRAFLQDGLRNITMIIISLQWITFQWRFILLQWNEKSIQPVRNENIIQRARNDDLISHFTALLKWSRLTHFPMCSNSLFVVNGNWYFRGIFPSFLKKHFMWRTACIRGSCVRPVQVLSTSWPPQKCKRYPVIDVRQHRIRKLSNKVSPVEVRGFE